MGYKIGFDVGGTNIVGGLINREGNLVHTIKRPTEAKQGFEHVMDRMATIAQDLLTEKGIDAAQVEAIGVGIPGFIDPIRGVVMKAANLQWEEAPVADALSERTCRPVYIDNDVRMYVYGEASLGAGRDYDVVLGITICTGIAAGVVDHGRLYYGGGFIAGEFGHIRMEGLDHPCGCGLEGCLETVASATGIARLAREKVAAGVSTVMGKWVADGKKLEDLTAADVSHAYDEGDPAAIAVMNEVGTLLGRGLSYATTLYSPDIIVIGGGAAYAGERLLAPMRNELKRLVHPMYWNRLTIQLAERMEDAGVAGSAMYAAQRAKEAAN